MMKNFLRRWSLVPKGLRYKLMIVFSLMSIIPLLVVMYLATAYIFNSIPSITMVSIIILITILISYLGMILAKRLVEPVIDMALEAKLISSGKFDRKIKNDQADEVGELGKAINEMTERIRGNLGELSTYGERTKQINLEISKKVIALTNLLQVGDAITTSALSLKDILDLVSEKVAQTYETGYTILLRWKDEDEESMTVGACYNLPNSALKDINAKRGEGFLGNLMLDPKTISIDTKAPLSEDIRSFLDKHNLKNLIILPVSSHAKLIGFLIVGNQLDGFSYKGDDIGLYKVFARQISIAIENDYLFKKTKELSVADDLTGLYNKRYIAARLEEEIKRAILFQRPCSFAIIGIDDFGKMKQSYDNIAIEKALKRIAGILQKNTTEIGKTARLGASEFALLLPEVNKKRAATIAEGVRKVIEEAFAAKIDAEGVEHLTVSIGVSENPIDGSKADELMEKASKAVAIAKSLGRNRVIANIGGNNAV